MIEVKKFATVACFRFCPAICVKAFSKTTRALSHDSPSPGR
jgi:hypothetical protein